MANIFGRRRVTVCAVCVLLVFFDPVSAQLKKRKEVSIGYMLNFNPWKLAVNLGTFERVTGFTIKWLEIVDSYKATVAMANNEVELVVANSADIARAFSRQMPARLIYVCEEIHHSEALVVHKQWHVSNGGPIRSPRDLIGREIYVWYGSTAHYSLWSFLTEMGVAIVLDTDYMRGADCKLTPCHYKTEANAVTLIGRNQYEINELWKQEAIIACYVGLPELNEITQHGVVLFTNAMTAKWDKATFAGTIGHTKCCFAAFYTNNPQQGSLQGQISLIRQPPSMQIMMSKILLNYLFWKWQRSEVNVRHALDCFHQANYYYLNNTKEFAMEYVLDTIGTSRVSGAIASVTGGYDEKQVYNQLRLRRYPTMEQQISCLWMGCGNRSRVAYALKDLSQFLISLKEDWNVKGGLNTRLSQRDQKPWLRSTSDIRNVALAEVQDDYSKFLDVKYMQDIMASGQDGSYSLDTGAYVHLGYEIMAMFGPTRSLLIS